MIIALPVEDKSMAAKVCQSFGRAPYFLFYEPEGERAEFQENKAPMSQGGAGVQAAQQIVDGKARVLLTPRCGENAAAVLAEARVLIFQTEGDSIEGNIQAYQADRLRELKDIHPGQHRHQGQGK